MVMVPAAAASGVPKIGKWKKQGRESFSKTCQPTPEITDLAWWRAASIAPPLIRQLLAFHIARISIPTIKSVCAYIDMIDDWTCERYSRL
ncbi:hypothetical protein BDA96_03G469400 [Sorghum bicolor]|uniref:Uncharacterized protein n=2 Tax=Sorghum bicolor TaxID=4558 RepID=C5XIN3_SORBI|nr:hypothetical protein SORBI_3003G436750 [Sorghum bicolor]KAG0541127.1 hypothetical protein BDA96_03G469400 [Sorghum bicolor]